MIMAQRNSFEAGSANCATARSACSAILKLDYAKRLRILKAPFQNRAHEVQSIVKPMTADNHQLNLSKWHLAEVAISSKGQKTCQLTSDHKPIAFHLGSRLRTKFGASNSDKSVESSRKNLDFDITNDKQIKALLEQIDDWAIQYIFDHAPKILKKVVREDVVRENYKPLLTQYGDTTRVKTKINTAGDRVCQCWDEDRIHCDLPENWLAAEFDVQVAIPPLWIMGSSFGLTMETTNLLIHPLQNECPF